MLLELVITFAFLTIFYFSYVARVEKDDVIAQVQDIVTSFFHGMDPIIATLSPENLASFKASLSQEIKTKLDALPKEQQKESAANQALHDKGIRILVFTFVVLAFVTFLMAAMNKTFDWETILHYGVLSVAVAALVEFCFLQFIAKKYKSIDINTIMQIFSKELEK